MSQRATVRRVGGAALGPWLEDVARLRIAVFRDWPYLYDGDLAYEREYLDAYAKSADSVFVLAFDGDRVVGAATGLPLADDSDRVPAPVARRRAIGGRGVLLRRIGAAARVPGAGHRPSLLRRARGACAVAGSLRAAPRSVRWIAPHDDPRRPAGHRGNEAFWSKRGYVRQPGLTVRLAWRELGEASPSEKPLTFWTRPLPCRRAFRRDAFRAKHRA